MAALERSNLSIDGFPAVRLHNQKLDLTMDVGQSMVAEHLEPYEHGAFVVMPDRHTVLAHPIRDRSATAALTALVAAAGPPVYYLDDWGMTRVSLVGQYGSKHLDPRDRGLVERIAALPEVAPSPEEEAHAGNVDAAIMLAARSWGRGASDEADRWFELAREGSATAVLHIAFSMLPSDGDYLYEDDGLRATETDRVQRFADAASWLTHRAERGDPLARQVREALDDEESDEATRWGEAMRSVRAASSPPLDPPRVVLALGPADLGIDDIEAILDVLREQGGEPGITSVGRRERFRITELGTQPDAALEQLVLELIDGEVEVVLGRRGSRVVGPRPAAERIREIVSARSVPGARRNTILWVDALWSGFLAVLVVLVGGLAVANAGYDPRAMLVLLVALVVAALYTRMLFGAVARLRRDEGRRGSNSVPGTGGGRVRIRGRNGEG